ncbi:MAG: polysaccharide biosynthesis tyrosine autokinase [Gemmatimonadetes bacterium]|nr:polysaccharide biosynthesis tyrosine autokinase [Gemmatimonadota bacterium]
MKFAHLLRRRWHLLVALAALAGGAAWYTASSRPRTFTASVLVQRTAFSPMGQDKEAIGKSTEWDFGTQLELIRSSAVIGVVVDSLGGQLTLLSHARLRTRLIQAVSVDSAVKPAAYALAARGKQTVLLDPDARTVLAEAGPGEPLVYGGLRLWVRHAALPDEPVQLFVTSRQRALEALRNSILVEPGKGPELVRITITDADPERAAAVVNAIAKSYSRFRARSARLAANRSRQFLAQQLAVVADSLRLMQHRLMEYQQQEQLLNPAAQGQTAVTMLNQATALVQDLRFKQGLLSGLRAALRSERGNAPALERLVVLGNDVLPGGAELYNRMRELEIQRSRLTASRFGYTSNGPDVEVTDSLLKSVRSQMATLVDQALFLVQQRLAEGERQVAGLTNEVRDLPRRSTELTRLQDGVSAVQRTFDLLLGKYYEAQIAENVEQGDVEVIDPATVPVRPDPIHPALDAAIAALATLLLAIGAIGLERYFKDRVESREDAERASRLHVLGLIPRLPGAARPLAVGPRGSGEPFHMLATNLRLGTEAFPRLLVITSASPGEGKSTIAANLAVALARDRIRVLLVDADLRRPTLHKAFGRQRTPGLSDVLVREISLDAALARHEMLGLDLLPAGSARPNPPALLSSEEFSALLQQLRARYDVVVVDTTPVLAVTDASLVCAGADGIMFVVRADYTHRTAVRQAVEQLGRIRARIVGMALTDIPASTSYARAWYGYYNFPGYEGAPVAAGRGTAVSVSEQKT